MFDVTEKTARIKQPRLPWLIGALAFLAYALTLCHHVSLRNLPLSAQVAGWSGGYQTDRPLLWLLTSPLKVLPDAWIPLALNLQSAIFASLTLVFLARCVQLLPLNRLRAQSIFLRNSSGLFDRHDAWLPVALAAIVCGLELGFWQDAVSATAEILDVLLFAAAVWCVLEYRVSEKTSWLDWLAVIWGLGMAENWVMTAALPLLAATLIWLWGYGFLQAERWLRVLWRLLLGGSVFLVLPLVNSLSPHAPWSFKHAVKESVLVAAASLSGPYHEFAGFNTDMTIVMTLFLLLPVLPIIFRLSFHGSYHLSLQSRIELVVLQVVYLVSLVTELWVTLHPMSGPQNIMAHNSRLGTPLLTLVFLNALGVGYLSAHFLLICGANVADIRKNNPQFRLPPFLPEWLRRSVVPVLYALPVVMLVALLARNLGVIRDLNHSPLIRFAQAEIDCLPPGGGIIVSDDPQRLQFVQAELAWHPDYHQWVPVDTTRLADPYYRSNLEKKKPLGWTAIGATEPLTHEDMTHLLYWLSGTNRIYYLHPSFGFFFEYLKAEPHGLVFRVIPGPIQETVQPPLTPALIQENEQFWDRNWTNRMAVIPPQIPVESTTPEQAWDKFFSLADPDSHAARLAGEWYSMALDNWGVTLQHASQWTAAAHRFSQALALNTNNIAARLNLDYNRNRLNAGNTDLATAAGLLEEMLDHRRWTQNLLKSDGLFDGPMMNYSLGLLFQEVGLPHEAVQFMSRASALAPNEVIPQLTLAELYVRDQMHDQALQTINNIRRQSASQPLNEETRVRLNLLEAGAWLNTTNQAAGERILRSTVQKRSQDPHLLNTAVDIFEQAGELTNALVLIDEQLTATPNNLPLLTAKVGLLQKSGQYAQAMHTLDQVMTLTNSYTLQLDYASDRMMTGDLAGAEADFRRLEDSPVERWRPYYGLAQIAIRRHDTNSAMNLLEACYTNTPEGSAKQTLVFLQLQQLKAMARQ